MNVPKKDKGEKMKLTNKASVGEWIQFGANCIVRRSEIVGFLDNGEEITVKIVGFLNSPRLSRCEANKAFKDWGISF